MHGVTDYSMARRAVLEGYRVGTVARADICDAQPELLRAAIHQGEQLRAPCPVCESESAVRVTFAFGERLAKRNGRLIGTTEIASYLDLEGVRCYSVEVCTACAWNHIMRAYVGRNPETDSTASYGDPPRAD